MSLYRRFGPPHGCVDHPSWQRAHPVRAALLFSLDITLPICCLGMAVILIAGELDATTLMLAVLIGVAPIAVGTYVGWIVFRSQPRNRTDDPESDLG